MSFAYYETETKITCTLEAACEKAVAIFDLLGWKSEGIKNNEIVAKTSFNAFGWGERVTVIFPTKHRILVSSESLNPFQLFDLGKNQQNVKKFLTIFKTEKLPLETSEFAGEKRRSFLGRFFSSR